MHSEAFTKFIKWRGKELFKKKIIITREDFMNGHSDG